MKNKVKFIQVEKEKSMLDYLLQEHLISTDHESPDDGSERVTLCGHSQLQEGSYKPLSII